MKKKGNGNKKPKPSRNWSKEQCQAQHAKTRARQRYGLNLNNSDLQTIVNYIQTGNSQLLEHQTSRVSVHSIAVDNRDIPVVYDSSRHTIVSFLPQSYFSNKVS